MLSILLIDDDSFEYHVVRKILLLALNRDDFDLVYAKTIEEAMSFARKRPFDMVLLDNMLTKSMTAETSVPMIKDASNNTPIAIISNSVEPDYLSGPEVLDVEYVIDKRDMVGFLNGICRQYSASGTLAAPAWGAYA